VSRSAGGFDEPRERSCFQLTFGENNQAFKTRLTANRHLGSARLKRTRRCMAEMRKSMFGACSASHFKVCGKKFTLPISGIRSVLAD
jgi:hypothetical protein